MDEAAQQRQVAAIVDADPASRQRLGEALSELGLAVDGYDTLREAAAVLLDAPPDLLVAEARLPDGSGYDLVAQLRATYPPTQLPIVMCGASGDEADLLRGFAAGADDYLPKPVGLGVLLAKCRRLLAAKVPREPASSLELPAGALAFGRYEVERALGAGAHGAVYLALDRWSGERVALKLLAGPSSAQPEDRLRFFREAYALSAVRGPHLVRVRDFGGAGGQLYCAMELVAGPTLADHVRASGPAREADVVHLLSGLARALAVLERAEIVHRDIKPANVILRDARYDRPVLVDFGLAKRAIDRGVTSPDQMVGTPGYMAPEWLRGDAIDRRGDLFALGMVARYALVGADPFPGLRGLRVLQAMAERRMTLPEHLSPGLRRVIARAIEPEPRRRYDSARDLLEALVGVDLELGSPAPASVEPPADERPTTRGASSDTDKLPEGAA